MVTMIADTIRHTYRCLVRNCTVFWLALSGHGKVMRTGSGQLSALSAAAKANTLLGGCISTQQIAGVPVADHVLGSPSPQGLPTSGLLGAVAVGGSGSVLKSSPLSPSHSTIRDPSPPRTCGFGRCKIETRESTPTDDSCTNNIHQAKRIQHLGAE